MKNKFLDASKYIDFNHPTVAEAAARIAQGAQRETDIVHNAFTFVRDKIHHSWDDRRSGRPTCKASEVLQEGTGWCYAKSHLLAALLRANHIPAGLCYQRLILDKRAATYCLHGLNAVYLEDHAWLRLDARGNKPGVDARFDPPGEFLAFSLSHPGEFELPEIWPEPLYEIRRTLEACESDEAVFLNLPDVTPLPHLIASNGSRSR
ncbi:transglutaminase-like domain-containing protein [Methylocystis iwaonis]|uniref:Cro/Cl family transcriptional regulator n=1 Tax=Methylocystis iwaonis TaxID=2885079 RepID=A0ABN6VJK6_9HYPH|nr:transglutaminase family protein [Methylocystis iwaonis]BDV34955.1 Cro/Cl family transcriptional regulator [Methylocystis iwaonis]